jgi:hypothetical protein
LGVVVVIVVGRREKGGAQLESSSMHDLAASEEGVQLIKSSSRHNLVPLKSESDALSAVGMQ